MASMDFQGSLAGKNKAGRARSSWHGTAFVVESLVLLLFLAFSLAVFFALIGGSYSKAEESQMATGATVAATSVAECFAANPGAVPDSQTLGEYVVETTSTPQMMDGGVLYNAEIVVYLDGTEQYRMCTARYVSEVGDGQ